MSEPLRKHINTNIQAVSCDVCERTLLRGERAEVFIAAGVRRNVCDLCTVRAAHQGWIREGVDDPSLSSSDDRRRGSFREFLRARRAQQALEPGGAEAMFAPSRHDTEPDLPAAGDPDAPRFVPVEAPRPQLDPALAEDHRAARAVISAQQPTPDELLYEDRTVRAIPTNVELKLARAIELFNASAHVRTVAGVSRTLGLPQVCARPSATEGSVVTIVVAWELSWYRFEVDLGDEAAGVRVVGQGAEVDELEPAERVANAIVERGGTIRQAAAVS